VVYNEFTGASTRTMIDNGATLEKLTEETFIKIIAGEKSVDEFDKYVETWKNLGGDKITEEVNEWYKQ
jgi:extracellular solute-binding protein family 1